MIDVRDASSFKQSTCKLPSGHVYHYVDQPPSSPPKARGTCLLLHGFPDSWYGWRYQIKALSEAGYRVLANTQLGYAPSSQPDDLNTYSYKSLAEDLVQLLNHAQVNEKIFLFGHDWGGLLAWRFANYRPERVKAIAVACTPYMPPAQRGDTWVPLDQVVKKLPNFGYQLFFQSDEGRELLSSNLDSFLIPSFAQTSKPASAQPPRQGLPPWTYPGEFRTRLQRLEEARKQGSKPIKPARSDDPELCFYLDSFHKSGIKHALNYYRTQEICFKEEQASGVPSKFPQGIPVYFLTGDSDEALTLKMSDGSPRFFEPGQYKREVLEGADHWMLQNIKYRDEISRRFVGWCDSNSQPQAKL